jgi:hypothetical protein
MHKPYHERPDWILKSIVYFCDNYTIDGEDLRKYKRGAIDIFREAGCPDGILNRLPSGFDGSPQGWDFWDCFYWLQTGWEPGAMDPDVGTECPRWTDYEKRKIAKMPRVK